MLRQRSSHFALILSALVNCWLTPASRAADEVRVVSPDERVQLKLSLTEGRLHYAVSFRNQPVIETSPLIMTVDGADVTAGVTLGDAKPYQVKETYPWRGVHAQAVNHGNGLTVRLKHANANADFTLDVRAYNDSVAFRSIVPGQGPRVPDEATRFT